jgi:hypothetical protein
MMAGVWLGPAELAGVVAILWATIWLERFVAPPAKGGARTPLAGR